MRVEKAYKYILLTWWQQLVHRPANDATLRGTDKVEDQTTLVALGDLFLDDAESLTIIESTLVERTVDIVDAEDLLISKATATQPNDIDTAVDDGITTDERVGGDILVHTRSPLDHDVLRDAHELMDE